MIALVVLAFMPWAGKLRESTQRPLDPDELQHLHTAWCTAHGLVPYKDFFEHHTPGLYFHLAPIVAAMSPEASADAAWDTVIACRHVMWVWTGAALGLLGLLGWRWRGPTVGAVAVCVLSNLEFFWRKAIEVRPDVPATALVLAALLCFELGIGRDVDARTQRPRRAAWCFLGGAAFAAAILFTQKVGFVAVGLVAFAVYYACDRRFVAPRGVRLARIAWALAGASIPLAIVLAWFWRHDAIGELLYFNIAFNADWQSQFSPLPDLWSLIRADPALPFGLVACAACGFTARGVRAGDGLLVASALGGLLGVFVIQEPFLQCYQDLLPVLALMVADLVVVIATRVAQRWQWPWLAPAAVAVAAVGLVARAPVNRDSNDEDRDVLTWVMDHTAPDDTVVGGFPGYGAFRPHPWFYWSLQQPMIAMIPQAEKDRITDAMVSGALRPKLISLGSAGMLSGRMWAAVRDHYSPGIETYWIRNDGPPR